MNPPVIVWFRLDLRLTDNPAFEAAAALRHPVIPVYIWSPDEDHPWEPGAASRWWLHQSLFALNKDLARRRNRLIIRQGKSLEELKRLLEETGARHIFWNRRYEPAAIARDRIIKEAMAHQGVSAQSFNSALLFEP